MSKEAVEKWALDKYIQESKKTWTLSVDVDFLNMIDDRRDALAKNIYLRYGNERNRDLDRLNNIVGDIVDKIIFLRIAEDKKIENSWNLETIANGKEIWKHLISYFEASDKKYNSWLFDNTEIFKKFELDDKILKQILLSLYYPACPYEFSVLGVDILGNIYEKFLGKTLVREWRTIKTEFKPDVKKAWGVFYTPQYIVDYIVKNTVWEILKWKNPKQALELNIVDPACGSGAFLIWAYDYILNWFIEQHTSKPEIIKKSIKEGKIYQYKEGYHLSFAYKKDILKNMIYGVDIDRQAVAVSRLSLLLKLLEWETAETANQLFSTIDAALLPKLDNNIKCGNSLIDSSIYENLESPDEAIIKKINAFDWEKEFVKVFEKWGFDAVIGNPPYVLVENKNRDEISLNYFKDKYFSASYKIDLYHLFFEKGIKLLNDKGLLWFITPSNFLTNNWLKKLREFFLTKSNISEINVIMGKVFEWASVDTAVTTLSNAKIKKSKYTISEHNWFGLSPISIDEFSQDVFLQNEWYIFTATTKTKINKEIFELWEHFDVKFGMQLRNRKIYTTDIINVDEKDKITDKHKPCYTGKDVNRYITNYSWLLCFADRTAKQWGCRDFDIHQTKPKILVRQIGEIPICSLDENWFFCLNTMFMITPKSNCEYNIKYVLGILNSKFIGNYRSKHFSDKRTTFPKIKWSYLEKLPIPTASEPEQQPIIELVDQMLLAQKKLKEAEFEDDKKIIAKQIEIIDGKIDNFVFDLYWLSKEEKKVVLGG